MGSGARRRPPRRRREVRRRPAHRPLARAQAGLAPRAGGRRDGGGYAEVGAAGGEELEGEDDGADEDVAVDEVGDDNLLRHGHALFYSFTSRLHALWRVRTLLSTRLDTTTCAATHATREATSVGPWLLLDELARDDELRLTSCLKLPMSLASPWLLLDEQEREGDGPSMSCYTGQGKRRRAALPEHVLLHGTRQQTTSCAARACLATSATRHLS